jgi:hypothetical protein
LISALMTTEFCLAAIMKVDHDYHIYKSQKVSLVF